MSLSTKEYFIRETYKSIKRNGLMSLASVSTVALSLLVLGMFLLIFINTNNFSCNISKVKCRLLFIWKILLKPLGKRYEADTGEFCPVF